VIGALFVAYLGMGTVYLLARTRFGYFAAITILRRPTLLDPQPAASHVSTEVFSARIPIGRVSIGRREVTTL
jgi:hypothetical protein